MLQYHLDPHSALVPSPQKRFPGGVSSCAEKAPWNVLIEKKDTRRRRQSSSRISVLCGGSLVSETHVVTAAHCVWANRYRFLASHWSAFANPDL